VLEDSESFLNAKFEERDHCAEDLEKVGSHDYDEPEVEELEFIEEA
jgi:hypothetical protein